MLTTTALKCFLRQKRFGSAFQLNATGAQPGHLCVLNFCKEGIEKISLNNALFAMNKVKAPISSVRCFTSIGIDVAASTEGTGRFLFGYDRDTFVIVPRKNDGEAMTLVFFGCVYAKGLNEVNFNHLVASGKAAKKQLNPNLD